MAQKVMLLALAGAMGTLARWALAETVQRIVGQGFPWGTVVVNAVGCFCFGAVFALAGDRLAIGPHGRTIILVGFMGAFTTFSTFISDTSGLLTQAGWLPAAGNILLHNTAGDLLFFVGLAVGRAA